MTTLLSQPVLYYSVRETACDHPSLDRHIYRRYRSSRILCCLLFALITSTALQAQDPNDSLRMRFGIVGSRLVDFHRADFPHLPGTVSCCSTFTGGSGSGIAVGVLVEAPLDESFLVAARVLYEKHINSMTTREPTHLLINGSGVDGAFLHRLDASFDLIGVQPSIMVRPLPSLNVHIGAQLAALMSSTYTQSEQLSEPAGIGTFMNADGSDSRKRTRNTFTGSLPNTRLQFNIVAGTSYELPLNRKKTTLLVPEIWYSHGVSTLMQDVDWSVSSVLFNLALKYSPGAKKILRYENREEYDTITVPRVAQEDSRYVVDGKLTVYVDTSETDDEITIRETRRRRDTLFVLTKPRIVNASIHAFSLDLNNRESTVAQLRVEEYLSSDLAPLLPYVFFEHNSASIAPRYQTSGASRNLDFLEHMVGKQDRISMYYEILNIIGFRMARSSKGTITLTGCTSNVNEEERNLPLALERAEHIKSYLVSEWHIAPERIKTESRLLPAIASNSQTEFGAAENRRVEIGSSDFSIIGPIESRDTVRVSNPPTVSFRTRAEATAGVASWSITTHQATRSLKSWSGTSTPPSLIEWQLNHDQRVTPSLDEKLVVRLTVRDSIDQERSASDSIDVQLTTIRKKKLERRNDKEIAHYGVTLFAIRHSDLSALDKNVLALVKKNIQVNSSISVFGYTDRSGDPTFNKALATSRAKTVAAELSPFNVVSTEVRSEQLPYNNELPEGRFYSRTVEIEVATPVQY